MNKNKKSTNVSWPQIVLIFSSCHTQLLPLSVFYCKTKVIIFNMYEKKKTTFILLYYCKSANIKWRQISMLGCMKSKWLKSWSYGSPTQPNLTDTSSTESQLRTKWTKIGVHSQGLCPNHLWIRAFHSKRTRNWSWVCSSLSSLRKSSAEQGGPVGILAASFIQRGLMNSDKPDLTVVEITTSI